MKTIITNILIVLSFFNVFGQTDNRAKYRFSKEVFNSKEYVKTEYDRFSGKIDSIDSNTYRFGEKILKIETGNTEFLKLIDNGIFNPDVIFGKETTKKTKAKIDSLSQNQKVFFNLSRNDSLAICCFEQLEKINPNSQTKRFKFWVFRIGVSNPTEYYIELYNDKATKETELDEFIENSKMSFYYKGTLII
ncbi:hypothetical protein [Thalassobellus citreus]|uniref:hypothetical protein n=1 Tax=Thalassobellus citreus TaxID=3367752 RepID=UPI0037B37E21